MADARWSDAAVHQLVVEPGGQPATEGETHGFVERRDHLEQHEREPHGDQGHGQGPAVLNRSHQNPHGDREDGRRHATGQQGCPPEEGQSGVGPGKAAEQLPLRTLTQLPETGHEAARRRRRWRHPPIMAADVGGVGEPRTCGRYWVEPAGSGGPE